MDSNNTEQMAALVAAGDMPITTKCARSQKPVDMYLEGLTRSIPPSDKRSLPECIACWK